MNSIELWMENYFGATYLVGGIFFFIVGSIHYTLHPDEFNFSIGEDAGGWYTMLVVGWPLVIGVLILFGITGAGIFLLTFSFSIPKRMWDYFKFN